MKYRKLGNTGMVVSSLGLGTMYFGDETPEKEAFNILDAFIEAGGNLIDTADVYVGGVAEQAELALDAESATVEKVSAPTPGGYPYGDFGRGQRERSLDSSAQALRSIVGSGSDHPLGRV
jgi:aryl-alcohol dehydrogenase-like predicted oxidoreductase